MDAEPAAARGLSETARVAREALADVAPEPGVAKPDPILTAAGLSIGTRIHPVRVIAGRLSIERSRIAPRARR